MNLEPKSEAGQPYPFLGYQKNSILRRSKKREDSPTIPEGASPPFFYQKPHQLCKTTDQALPMYWKDKNLFAREWSLQIESYIRYYGLQIRLMKNEDTPGILEFLSRRYPPHIASEISPFDLYRFRNFGHGILLEDASGKIQGTIFEELYGTSEKTSYTMRLAVSEEYKGKNLGYHVMIFSSLKAMEQGARVKRGLIEFYNLRSLHVNLNKVGWICDGFEPNISGLGAFFKIALPLHPQGLTSNVIDTHRVMDFIQNHSPEYDYRLIAAGDYDGICNLYEETDFKVSALLNAGIVGKETYFLALPARSLQMNVF